MSACRHLIEVGRLLGTRKLAHRIKVVSPIRPIHTCNAQQKKYIVAITRLNGWHHHGGRPRRVRV